MRILTTRRATEKAARTHWMLCCLLLLFVLTAHTQYGAEPAQAAPSNGTAASTVKASPATEKPDQRAGAPARKKTPAKSRKSPAPKSTKPAAKKAGKKNSRKAAHPAQTRPVKRQQTGPTKQALPVKQAQPAKQAESVSQTEPAKQAEPLKQAEAGERETPDKNKPGLPGVTNSTAPQPSSPVPAAAIPDATGAAHDDDPALASAAAKEAPKKPTGPPAKCLRWRFQGRDLLCVTDKDATETVLKHVIHVRAGSGQGDGSVETPYAGINEALAAAGNETDSPVIYVWEGSYISREPASSSSGNLLIAGSGAAVALPGGRVLPPQTTRGPVWAVERKPADTIRRYSPSPYAPSNSTAREEKPFSGPLLQMHAGSALRVSGLTMHGNGEGVAISVGTREDGENCGSLELSHCTVSDFDTGVFSCGPIVLSRNNVFSRNSACAVDSTSRNTPAVRLGEKNTLSGNGYGLHAPWGTVELRKDNLIEDNLNHAVLAADILLGEDNIVRRNEKGLSAAGAIRLKKDNFIQDNRSDGATAARIFLGDRNNVNGNEGAGLAALPGSGESGESRLELGNFNMIMDNTRDGLYCEGPGTIVLGNDNHVLRNNFSDLPGIGSGIKNLDGDIVLGNGNSVNRNGQFGIAAPLGKIVLGKNNRIKDNNRSGILTGATLIQGPDNDITHNSRAVAGDKNIQTVPVDSGSNRPRN